MRLPSAAFAAFALGLSAQSPHLGGLLQLWAVQPLTAGLRDRSPAAPLGHGYYDASNPTLAEGLLIRRAQLQVSGEAPGLEGLGYGLMADFAVTPTSADPARSNAPYNPSLLQDAWVEARLSGGLRLKVGQFKPLQTWEGLQPPSELLFAERSQLARRFGDRRDRGATLEWREGARSAEFRVALGVFNGTSDLSAGKAPDANGRRDAVARLEAAWRGHRFGLYGLRGATDQPDAHLQAKAFPGPNAPTPQAVLADGDRTTQLGAFYVLDAGAWHAEAEALGGRWGRRAPSLGLQAGPAGREALDQRFLALCASLVYATGPHRVALRWDRLDANDGNRWTTATDPYTDGLPYDATPRFTELTLGYTRLLARGVHARVNLLHRSGPLFAPAPGETRATAGDSLLAAFQWAF